MRFTNIYLAISSLIYASFTNTDAYLEDDLPMDDLVAAIATAAINGAIPFHFMNFHEPGTRNSPEKIRIPVLLIRESELLENPKYTAKYGSMNGFRGGKNVPNRFQNINQLQKPDYSPKPKYPTNGIRIVPAPKLHAPVDDLKPVSNRQSLYENRPLRHPSIKLVKQPPVTKPVYDDEDEEQAQHSPAVPVAPAPSLAPVTAKVSAKVSPTKGKIPDRYLNLLPPLPEGADTYKYNKNPLEFLKQEDGPFRAEPVVRHKTVNLGDVYRKPEEEESQEASHEASQEQNGSQEQNFDGYVKTPYDSQLVTTLKKLMTTNNKKDNLNLNIGGEVYQTSKESSISNNNNNLYESNFKTRVNTNADYYQTETQSIVNNNHVNNNNNQLNINQPQKFYYRPPVTRLITNGNNNNNDNNENYRSYTTQPIVYQRENTVLPQSNVLSQQVPQQSAIPFPSPFSQTTLTDSQLPQTVQYYQNSQQTQDNSLPSINEFRSNIPDKYLTPYSEQQRLIAEQQQQQQQRQQQQQQFQYQQQQQIPYRPVFESNSEPIIPNDDDDSGYTQMVQFLPPKTTRQRFIVPIESAFNAKQPNYFLNDGNSKVTQSQTQTYILDQQQIQNEHQPTPNGQTSGNSYVVSGIYRQQVQDQDSDDKNVAQEEDNAQNSDNADDSNEEQKAEQDSNDDHNDDNDNNNSSDGKKYRRSS